MRVPGWLFLIGIVLVVGLTALLSLVAFNVARQVAIDAGELGIQFISPEDTIASFPTQLERLRLKQRLTRRAHRLSRRRRLTQRLPTNGARSALRSYC
jgi:hypothetical protein